MKGSKYIRTKGYIGFIGIESYLERSNINYSIGNSLSVRTTGKGAVFQCALVPLNRDCCLLVF